jgi:hypothetical protein
MASPGISRRVALVRTDVEKIPSVLVFCHNVRRLLVAPSSPILDTLMKEDLSSYETSVLRKAHSVISQKTKLFIVTAV